MGQAVPCFRSNIGRTVVPGCDAHCDSQQSRRLQFLVKLHLKVCGRSAFRAAPTYGDYRRVVFGIVNGLGDRVQKAVGRGIVWCKIHYELRARSRGACDLDVEDNFGIIAIGAARGVRATVDGDWNYCGRREAKLREIRVEIGRPIAAA